jgi:hypothetical protein
MKETVMSVRGNDEIHAQELAKRLREEPRPLCPQLHSCDHERLYPVEGYCVLADSPGWFMIPSIEEYRQYCTTPRFGECRWFRGAGANSGPVEGQPRERPTRTDLWSPPEVLKPTLGDTI